MEDKPSTRAPRRNGFGSVTALEMLEHRLLLDGNVTAVLSGGHLVVTGDALDNNVVIDQAGLPDDQYRVSPGDALTTINGAGAETIVGGVIGDVRIKLKDGHDVLRVIDVDVLRNLTIDAGAGHNQVTVDPSTVGRDLTVKCRDGSDDVTSIAYKLSRNADLSIYFENPEGERFYFRHNRPRSAGEYGVQWGGTINQAYWLENEYGRQLVESWVLPDGIYTLESGNGTDGIGVIVVGYDTYDSYAYAGGMGLAAINPDVN